MPARGLFNPSLHSKAFLPSLLLMLLRTYHIWGILGNPRSFCFSFLKRGEKKSHHRNTGVENDENGGDTTGTTDNVARQHNRLPSFFCRSPRTHRSGTYCSYALASRALRQEGGTEE